MAVEGSLGQQPVPGGDTDTVCRELHAVKAVPSHVRDKEREACATKLSRANQRRQQAEHADRSLPDDRASQWTEARLWRTGAAALKLVDGLWLL